MIELLIIYSLSNSAQVLSAFTKKKMQGVKREGGFNSSQPHDSAKSIRCSLKVRLR